MQVQLSTYKGWHVFVNKVGNDTNVCAYKDNKPGLTPRSLAVYADTIEDIHKAIDNGAVMVTI